MKNKEKRILTILLIILIGLDQFFKIIFISTGAIIGNPDNWSLGIITNVKSESNIQYILISIIAVIALINYITRNNTYIKLCSKIVICFAIAGAISNLIDRIWNQATINYINIPRLPSINFGYIYIAIMWIGMAAILTKYTRKEIKNKKERNRNK